MCPLKATYVEKLSYCDCRDCGKYATFKSGTNRSAEGLLAASANAGVEANLMEEVNLFRMRMDTFTTFLLAQSNF